MLYKQMDNWTADYNSRLDLNTEILQEYDI